MALFGDRIRQLVPLSRSLPEMLTNFSLLLILLAQSSPSLFVVIRCLVYWVAVAKRAFVVDRLCKADSGRKEGCLVVSLMGAAVASSLIVGQLKKALPRSMKSALIPAGLVAVSPHYANYVTG